MGAFVAGDVVVVPFPFSDLTSTKVRPAVVLAPLDGDDIILCQVTSVTSRDRYAVKLTQNDFLTGTLNKESYARPSRIFTADSAIVTKKAGTLTPTKLKDVLASLTAILTPQSP